MKFCTPSELRLWRTRMLFLSKSKGHKSKAPYSGFPNHLQTKSNLHISICQNQIHTLCIVSIPNGWPCTADNLCIKQGNVGLKSAAYKQERLQIKSGVWWRAYGRLYTVRNKLGSVCFVRIIEISYGQGYLVLLARFMGLWCGNLVGGGVCNQCTSFCGHLWKI